MLRTRVRTKPEPKATAPRTAALALARSRTGSDLHGYELLESPPTTLADAVPAGQGERLNSSTRQDLERQLHWDFSQVRIHSGQEASRYAAYFGAPAYAVGNQIVLGDEKQRGGADDRALLRHEAIHVMQQGREDGTWRGRSLSVSRTGDSSEREAYALSRIGLPNGHVVAPVEPCVARAQPTSPQIVYVDPKDPTLKDRRQTIVTAALNPPAPTDPEQREKSPQSNRSLAEMCFHLIRYKASRQELPEGKTEEYYYQKLITLLTKAKTLADSERLRKKARSLEAQWVYAEPTSGREEALTASLQQNKLPNGEEVEVRKRERWTATAKIAGRFTVYLYRSKGEKEWYKRAHIYGEIQLEPARKTGPGKAEDEQTIKYISETLQDIESLAAGAAASGVTFDLEVRTTRKSGVATFKINSSKWIDSGNPWGDAKTMVEEIFHNIGLEDVYDYIEGHAENANYSIRERLILFHWQLTKYGSKDPKWRPDLPSITNKKASSPSDFDYCQVLAPYRPQFEQCLSERGVPAAP